MDRVNPVYIARNHHVEEALAAATAGDLEPFERLLDVLERPFDERPGSSPTPNLRPTSFGPLPDVLRHVTTLAPRERRVAQPEVVKVDARTRQNR